jgi:hypothetical protein
MSPLARLRCAFLGPLSVALVCSACEHEVSTSSTSSSGGGGGGLPSWFPDYWPEECPDPTKSPLYQPGCVDALRASCASLDTEDACDARPFPFQGFIVLCLWADVVRFADPLSCTVESASSRCIAGEMAGLAGYGDPCKYTPSFFTTWYAADSEQSLIKLLGSPYPPEGSIHYYQMCLDGVSPPTTSPLCNCTDVACAAQ